MYVTLATALGWTKSQVDAEEADYIDELVVALAAKRAVENKQG